jgi:hypothetical protein
VLIADLRPPQTAENLVSGSSQSVVEFIETDVTKRHTIKTRNIDSKKLSEVKKQSYEIMQDIPVMEAEVLWEVRLGSDQICLRTKIGQLLPLRSSQRMSRNALLCSL